MQVAAAARAPGILVCCDFGDRDASHHGFSGAVALDDCIKALRKPDIRSRSAKTPSFPYGGFEARATSGEACQPPPSAL
jgi:hypothetical protein